MCEALEIQSLPAFQGERDKRITHEKNTKKAHNRLGYQSGQGAPRLGMSWEGESGKTPSVQDLTEAFNIFIRQELHLFFHMRKLILRWVGQTAYDESTQFVSGRTRI